MHQLAIDSKLLRNKTTPKLNGLKQQLFMLTDLGVSCGLAKVVWIHTSLIFVLRQRPGQACPADDDGRRMKEQMATCKNS